MLITCLTSLYVLIILSSCFNLINNILGIFWSNVLQCDRNFPPYPYMYKKNFDDQLNEEKLMLTVDDVTFSVYLTTG